MAHHSNRLFPAAVVPRFRTVQALPAGNTVINHSLGQVPVVVDVRNASTGQSIMHRIVSETPTTTTIRVTTAVASARITII
jgi:hypothetical protein